MAEQYKSYFSHDSNARNDSKILDLRMKHGAEGYGVYFMIIERLREERDYMSVVDYNMLAFDFRVRSELVKSVVEDFGLFQFVKEGELFYSESLLKRMNIMEETSRAKSLAGQKGAKARWEKSENDGKNSSAIKNNGSAIAEPLKSMTYANENDGNKTKLKETKLNKTKQNSIDVLFEQFWQCYPKKVGKAKAKQSFQKINLDESLLNQMISKIEEYKQTSQWQKEHGQYIPNPATWLNQERWEDEINLPAEPVTEQERIMSL